MFVLKSSTTIKWPVAVQAPVDGGKVERMEFTAVFAMPTGEVMEEIRSLGDRDFFARVLLGWQHVQEGDKPLEFSPASRDRLADVPYIAKAVAAGYYAMASGEAVEQNLKKS